MTKKGFRKERFVAKKALPAMVLRNMRYSKFVTSPLCQRSIIVDF